MLQVLYRVCDRLGWNKGRSFPLEPLFQKKDAFRAAWSIILRNIPDFSKVHGINFLEDSWDYAIVLDACRFDVFHQVNTLEGKLEKKQSIGSMTTDWAAHAIMKQYPDIVLVNANPFLSTTHMKRKPFFKNIPAWKIGWDDELMVTPPWAMLDLSKKMAKRFPDKRIIFWFMQPHHPFIHSHMDFGWNMRDMMIGGKKGLKSVWTAVKYGELTVEQIWEAYKNNLELTMPYVEKLVDYLKGTIIVTSDHGNCFGEMGLFCHPYGTRIPPLIDVPLLTIEKKSR
jgi:hypothetical protein